VTEVSISQHCRDYKTSKILNNSALTYLLSVHQYQKSSILEASCVIGIVNFHTFITS